MYALITGASSGIGMEIATLLAKRGYHLIIVARRKERLEELAQKIRHQYQVTVIPMSYDLSCKEQCFALFDACKPYNVTVLINSAGYGKVGYFPELPLDVELNMIDTNIASLHILTKLFINHMKKGRILNIASIAGFQPGPMLTTYSATKAYVLNFSLAVNYELKRHKRNIHISTLCPGPVATEFDKVAGTNFSLKSITAEECAREAVEGLFQKKDLIIPGTQMKFMHLASKFSPYKLLLPIEYLIQTRKLK